MKTLRSLLWVLAFVLGASVASAMNNNDVVKMVKAELDDDTVILAINSAKSAEFDTSANALVELKNKGVSQTRLVWNDGAKTLTATGSDKAFAKSAPSLVQVMTK